MKAADNFAGSYYDNIYSGLVTGDPYFLFLQYTKSVTTITFRIFQYLLQLWFKILNTLIWYISLALLQLSNIYLSKSKSVFGKGLYYYFSLKILEHSFFIKKILKWLKNTEQKVIIFIIKIQTIYFGNLHFKTSSYIYES